MQGKIVLEEHFAIAETPVRLPNLSAAALEDLNKKLLDVHDQRLMEMDKNGIELSVLSINAPVVQGVPDPKSASELARRVNDGLAEHVAQRPDRFAGFATLPMQDPEAAVAELTRCVNELGFKGTMINGFSQTGDGETVAFYDQPEYRPFWQAVEGLDTIFYLHPRSPMPSWSRPYEGHPWFMASTWGFAAETALHALRLMACGIFDDYPKLKFYLGHLGEQIPYDIWRVDHRLRHEAVKCPAKQSFHHYLRNNFFLTTSGHFSTETLKMAIEIMGIDRVMFSIDYPFEQMDVAADWFDAIELDPADQLKIGRTNAIRELGLALS